MSARHVPLRELAFAAKTGFISKDLWKEFFSSRSESRNSRVWNRYLRDGYFKEHGSKMLPSVLAVGHKGIELLSRQGIPTVCKPHLGQFDHDEKAARLILELVKSGAVNDYSTEAELKRKFLVWMRTTREGRDAKFPDLLVRLKGTGAIRTIAIEIELSRKNPERYRKIMNSYSSAKNCDVVIFISDQESIFRRIANAMKDTNYPSWERPVGFGELQPWLKDPLNAPIHLSRKVTSIREWISGEKKTAA